MSLFSKRDSVMTEPTVTGIDVLRQTVKARNRSPHALSLIAREVDGVSASALEDFAAGKADLSVEILKALTKVLYPGAEFDPDHNLLQTPSLPARPMGIKPPPYDPAKHPSYHPPPAGPHTRGTSGITGLPPSPQAGPPTRPGWAR